MKFNGEYIKGVFVPDKSVEQKYKSLIGRSEREKMKVSIEIRKAERVSDSQMGLFQIVVDMIADQSGSSHGEVFQYLHKFRPYEKGEQVDLVRMDTRQLTDFIERAIIQANEEFHLNINIELLPGGKAKVKAC